MAGRFDPPSDLRFDVFTSGEFSQVRVTHTPSGLTAESDNWMTAFEARAQALERLQELLVAQGVSNPEITRIDALGVHGPLSPERPKRIRVVRILEYVFEDAETAERNMARWTHSVGGGWWDGGRGTWTGMQMRSATLPFETIEWEQ